MYWPENLERQIMFSIQKGYFGRESIAVFSVAEWFGVSWCVEKEAGMDTIPIGSIEYCEPVFGKNRKDFYPDFLNNHLYRTIRVTIGPICLEERCFVKLAEQWKSDFISHIMEVGETIPDGTWWLSKIVNFRNEWRYYVADGEVITTGWYKGENEEELAPSLNILWPKGFSGAVDFGQLDDGRIVLVEAHAPFACGWYGEDHKDYVLWQIIAWEHRNWWK